MKSLRELGLALSFVFGVFFLALLAELGYIFYWKNRRQLAAGTPPMPLSSKTIIDDIKQLNMNVMSKLPGVTTPFNYFMPKQASVTTAMELPEPTQLPPTALPSSFMDGYNNYPNTATTYKCLLSSFNINIDPSMGYDYDHAAYATAAGFLFPIKEETKEELEQLDACSLCSYDSTCKQNARLRNRTPSDVLTIPFTMSSGTPSSGSSSPTPLDAAEEASINMVEFEHKILLQDTEEASPHAHNTETLPSQGSFMMFGAGKCQPEPATGMTNSPRAKQQTWSMSPSMHRSSTTLRLLFERSPVLGPGFEPSYCSYVRQKQQQQQKQIMDGLQSANSCGAVSDPQHLSLGTLFQMPAPPPMASTATTGMSPMLPS